MLTTGKHMSNKIKHLLDSWPPNGVRTVSALKQCGYSQDLLNRYRYSGWLKSLGEGALMRPHDEPNLLGAIYALQNDLKLNVHIGGRSALELRGRAHYARLGRQSVWIFGEVRKLPSWFLHYPWEETLHFVSDKFEETHIHEGLVNLEFGNLSVLVSGDVRAMIELLTLVPKSLSLDEAKDLMGGLTSPNPKEILGLLKSCKSVKAKRLFMLLAEVNGHQWVEMIDQSEIDFGKGVRQIVPGGKLNNKYQLVVPESIFEFEGYSIEEIVGSKF
jgi:hypothetical protein